MPNTHFLRYPLNTKLLLILATLNCFAPMVAADNSRMQQTKSQLQRIDDQINVLQKTLTTVQDKRNDLNKELASTEKQIGAGVHQLQIVQQDMAQKQSKINNLQQTINKLNAKLAQHQALLAQHVRARYATGPNQPVKWLLNQDDPYAINRVLTYYQYLIVSRQKLIDVIDETKSNISATQATLHEEVIAKQQLQLEINTHQHNLEQDKRHHTALIATVDTEIKTKEHTLDEFQRNKKNLHQLLQTLMTQSITQPKNPFPQMRKKLPRPVKGQQMVPMNQGVAFFAGEGQPVTAVYPGKVVFSDWLKGYGLLIIVDHGQGFMTLYAHNQSLFKNKGQQVLQGEQIATVGHSGGLKQNGLYFEVRYRGRAVPPQNWIA